MRQKHFQDGNITTAYIAEEFPDGSFCVAPTETEAQALAVIVIVINRRLQDRAVQISGALDNHRRIVPADWVVNIGEEFFSNPWA